MKQTTFASAAWDKKGKVTLRERFLAEMDDSEGACNFKSVSVVAAQQLCAERYLRRDRLAGKTAPAYGEGQNKSR